MSNLHLPADVEAESALLGALLLSKGRILPQVEALISSKDFYRPLHADVYDAIMQLRQKGDAIDRITVQHWLTQAGRCKGLQPEDLKTYIRSLAETTVYASHGVAYAKRVKEQGMRRRIIETALAVQEMAVDEEEAIEAVMAKSEGMMRDAIHAGIGSSHIAMPELSRSGMQTLYELKARAGSLAGLPSGLHAWDDLLGGMERGNLILIAGRPAMGKTGAAVSIMLNVLVSGGRVGFFSLEMTAEQIWRRMISIATGFTGTAFRNGTLTEEQLEQVELVNRHLVEWPLLIDDTPAISAEDMLCKARAMEGDLGRIDLLIVDYLQKMKPTVPRGANREQEVGSMAVGLKNLAKTMNCPVLALAQLNRGVERRDDKRPTLSDLNESGKIEAESDSVTFLYRPNYYANHQEQQAMGALLQDDFAPEDVEWIVSKNRHGRTGVANLCFAPATASFDNQERERW